MQILRKTNKIPGTFRVITLPSVAYFLDICFQLHNSNTVCVVSVSLQADHTAFL